MNELAKIDNAEMIFEPTNLTKDTIKKYLCSNASDQELMMGLQIAQTFKLNPLKREVYFVKYGTSPMQVLVGYEVYIKRAERSGKYNGLEITSQGSVAGKDLKAIVKVFRKDWTNPLTHEAYYTEYVQTKADGTVNKFWSSKPITMIKKVAVSQAFRMAFPDEFDGMPYTTDEVVDQERVIDIKAEPELKMPVIKATEPIVGTIGEKIGIDTKVIEKAEKKVVEPEDIKYDVTLGSIPNTLSVESILSNEDGLSLRAYLKKGGWLIQDLKEFIFFTFELDSPAKICYKHLPEIHEYFLKAKPKEGK
jgi:phage recombination protein Bet